MTFHQSDWKRAVLPLGLLLGACNPGVPLDSLDWVRTTPRNADLRGAYKAYAYGTNGRDLLPPNVEIVMSLHRDGSLEIVGPAKSPPLAEDVGELADGLCAARGRWAAVQHEDRYWYLDLDLREPIGKKLSFHLSHATDPSNGPRYGAYDYFGDADAGHVVGWSRVASEKAIDAPSSTDAAEPTPLPITEELREEWARQDADERRFFRTILSIVLGSVVAVGAVVVVSIACVISLVIAWRRSKAAAFRLLGALAGAVGGLPMGVVGVLLLNRLCGWPVRGWIAAPLGGIGVAALAAWTGWIAANVIVQMLRARRRSGSPSHS